MIVIYLKSKEMPFACYYIKYIPFEAHSNQQIVNSLTHTLEEIFQNLINSYSNMLEC